MEATTESSPMYEAARSEDACRASVSNVIWGDCREGSADGPWLLLRFVGGALECIAVFGESERDRVVS